MSATLEGLSLQSVMSNAMSLTSQGRSYPVEQVYLPVKSQQDWLIQTIQCVLQLVTEEPQGVLAPSVNYHGNILVFLPGQKQISRVYNVLKEKLDPAVYQLCMLYGALPAKQQDEAITANTDGRVKIVLATNIAESSLTIADISIVVDSGYKNKLVSMLKRAAQNSQR